MTKAGPRSSINMGKAITRQKMWFLVGMAFGFSVSILLFQPKYVNRTDITVETISVDHAHDEVDYERAPRNFRAEDSHVHNDDTDVADTLANEVRVLCWIMTSPTNLRKKADAVKSTWGQRCNVLLFFSSVYDPHLPTIALNVSEGRTHLTAKTMLAFDYIYEHYIDKADWFMKCDDDTYVIVENLRYFLSTKNPRKPVYYGQHFHPNVKQGYYSGGAGYVLSKEALFRFSERSDKMCREDYGAEDVEIGKCMEKLGISTDNSLDNLGRSRFHCFTPEAHLFGEYPAWYYKWTAGQGVGNISDYAISFHYISGRKMQALEFFIYHLRPYGIVSRDQDLNSPLDKSI